MKHASLWACLLCLTGPVAGCSVQADLDSLPFSKPDAGSTDQPAAAGAKATPSAGARAEPPSAAAGAAAAAGSAAPVPTAPSDSDDAPGTMLPNQVPSASGEPGRGAAIAIAPDDSLALVVNRDVGSVSVMALGYDKAALTQLDLIKELPLAKGAEPYQVVFAPDGASAYVVLRRDQKLVKLGALASAPAIMGSADVGSEPTGLAISGDGRYAYVANWNDGTVSEVDTSSMQSRSIDLNAALVQTGYLGELQPRAALAHPRSLALAGRTLYVTEFFAQQVAPELADGSNADTRKVGLVYKVNLDDHSVSTLALGALADLGFADENQGQAGCYPNQLQSIALNGDYAYVLSVCASPKGPLGVKATTTACTTAADCGGNFVEPACITPFAGAANNVCVDVASVKTTTAPVLSIVDTRTGKELASGPVSLNERFDALFKMQQTPVAQQRFPLFASEIAFVPGTTVGYVSANGSDAVFRFQTDAKTGAIASVGGTTNAFIDLTPTGIAADKAGKNPIGMAIAHQHKKVALVANDVSRNVSALDFDAQAVTGGAQQARVTSSASLPAMGSDEDRVLRGKRFFNTGTARWSLRGQGWGACQSCHADGLTDNVTWYFARGPRQSTSLDGTFASTHPDDQRILNWTAIFDEVADFELNTRGISGGVGAIVSTVSMPPQTADRIDFQGLGHSGLSGSATQAADPTNPLQLAQAPKLNDWGDIEKYMQSIRSPRAPRSLDQAKVAQGHDIFTEQAKCQGCHGGEKWTVSSRFYKPSTDTNVALNVTPLVIGQGFPMTLLPAHETKNQTLRFDGGNAAQFDQILCALRPVGTFGVAEEGVGIAELRADMKAVAQGDGNPAGEGRGYNVPSLLGLSVGAPYLHAGNARTLEALFSDTFAQHHQALAANFLTETDPAERDQQISALVQYLLSIDEQSAYPALPASGASGGSLCTASAY